MPTIDGSIYVYIYVYISSSLSIYIYTNKYGYQCIHTDNYELIDVTIHDLDVLVGSLLESVRKAPGSIALLKSVGSFKLRFAQ